MVLFIHSVFFYLLFSVVFMISSSGNVCMVEKVCCVCVELFHHVIYRVHSVLEKFLKMLEF